MRNFRNWLVAAAVLLAGCSETRSIQGRWVFDREYTSAQISEQPSETPDSISGLLKPILSGLLVPALLNQMEGATLIISKDELIITTADGSGEARDYELVERPASNKWLIKTSDGKVQTITREGDRIGVSGSGDIAMNAWFKRAD